MKKTILAIAIAMLPLAGKSQLIMKAQHGTYQTVISTETISEPNNECGFTDLMITIVAIYKIETIKYEKFENGKLVATWTEKKKTFVRCADH
jgi:hypothetical protein